MIRKAQPAGREGGLRDRTRGRASCSAEPPRRRPHSRASQATPIIVGTKNFAEHYVLGQLYKQALEAKGFKVRTRRTSAPPS